MQWSSPLPFCLHLDGILCLIHRSLFSIRALQYEQLPKIWMNWWGACVLQVMILGKIFLWNLFFVAVVCFAFCFLTKVKASCDGVMYEILVSLLLWEVQHRHQPFSDLEFRVHLRQGSPISTQNVPEAQPSEGRAEVAFSQAVPLLSN